jgi:excisionase family DNA binding protein
MKEKRTLDLTDFRKAALHPNRLIPGLLRTFYTTGQVAGLLGCAPQTVAKMCRAGKLKYHLVNEHDRRIHRASLVAYMRSNGIPVPRSLIGQQRLVVCGLSEQAAAPIVDACRSRGVEGVLAPNAFALALASEGASHLVVCHSIGRDACRHVADHAAEHSVRAWILAAEDEGVDPQLYCDTAAWTRHLPWEALRSGELVRQVLDSLAEGVA